ncbi:MAG: nuclear transport factor 2 family protein [Herbiconiux sp.]|nr:nuclear transport factor 2 family protein [Herbiconiux sp.]
MTEPVASWIAGYRRAWESNLPADIESLFTPDARYEPAPSGEAWVGHSAIVAGWLAARDEPGDTEFAFEVIVDTPELGVVQGVSTYSDGSVYDNLWVIRRAPDGRATAFTDWWVERPTG